MLEPKKTAGENANQKILRLLRKLNVELVEEGSGEQIGVTLFGDGAGSLILNSPSRGRVLFGFTSTEELVSFLEASQLSRMLMLARWSVTALCKEDCRALPMTRRR
jgi:hypothetical protein